MCSSDLDLNVIAYARAAEAGRTYLPKAVFWAQGEQDEGLGTSQAAYVASARALQDDAAAHKLALTGDGSPFPFITYQNASHTQHAPYQPAIPLAHLQLAEEDADWALAVIMYIMDYTAGEHLTANSSRLAGAYYGLALYQWVFGKAKPWHLSPAAPVWGAKSIIIPFDHVVGALAFDTSRVSDPGNYGFTLVDDLGAAIAINTPVIVGNAVQITTATPIPSGSRLRYAWGAAGWAPGRLTGARGCLRDSQGDSIKFAAGGNFPMHKYCPIFEKVKP